MRLIVVGAGIAGSSVARAARARGHEVSVVDAGAPCSLAAMAVMRRAYHNGPELGLFDRTLELYEEWLVPVRRGAEVTSYRRQGITRDQDWRLVEPQAPLVTPTLLATVTRYGGRFAEVPGCRLDGDAVVMCTGYRLPGDTATWGHTWVHDDPRALRPGPLAVHHFAPYKTLVAGRVGQGVRLGSSSAASPAIAIDQARKMLGMAVRLGWIEGTEGWRRVSGRRWRSGALWGREEATGAWRLGGLHRTGYAMAPAAAEMLLDEIQEAGR